MQSELMESALVNMLVVGSNVSTARFAISQGIAVEQDLVDINEWAGVHNPNDRNLIRTIATSDHEFIAFFKERMSGTRRDDMVSYEDFTAILAARDLGGNSSAFSVFWAALGERK